MAPTPFKELVIVVSGTHPGYKQADLKSLIEQNGGKFSPRVTGECTHLVSTKKEVDAKGTKNEQAAKLDGCHVVSLSWLLDSVKAKKKVAEKDHSFDAPTASSTADSASANATMNGTSTTNDKAASQDSKVPSKKRSSVADSGESEKRSKKVKDGQNASSKNLTVEVDECYPAPAYSQVHIDDDGLIWDASLNQTNATANNNKFYKLQVLRVSGDRYVTWTRWGRVGENGQSATLGNGSMEVAKSHFVKKFQSKTGLQWEKRLDAPKPGKYTFIERNYEEDSEEEASGDNNKKKVTVKEKIPEVESRLSAEVQGLIAFIFNPQHFLSTMASMSYDVNKLPLGKLSKRTLQTGFQILKDLSELIQNQSLASSKYGTTFPAAAETLSNQYFTTIPHIFGRNRPPVITSNDLIKKEVDLLENLTDMEIANEINKVTFEDQMVHQLDRQFQGLNMSEMTALDHHSAEYLQLRDYLLGSHGATHYLRFKVQNIFRIARQGEEERFAKSKFAKIKKSNRRLLWHGSRSTNFGGILSQGLRIAPPEAPVQGYMFGKGVYFADISSKSANYCCSYNSGLVGLLLLCDVELGNPMLELQNGDYNAGQRAASEGKLATLGMGATVPQGWKDAGCVHDNLKGVLMPDVEQQMGPTTKNAGSLMYNEYIVYDVAQIRQRYLLQVHMT